MIYAYRYQHGRWRADLTDRESPPDPPEPGVYYLHGDGQGDDSAEVRRIIADGVPRLPDGTYRMTGALIIPATTEAS